MGWGRQRQNIWTWTTKNSKIRNVVACRLDRLRGNTPLEVSPFNTKEENSRIIAQKNWQKVHSQQINQIGKELSQLPKGNVKKKRSSIKFKLPETPPVTPQQVNEY